MNLDELTADIKRGKLSHVYLLTGEESYFLRRAKELILTALFPDPAERDGGLNALAGDPPTEDLIALINTAPFLAEKTVVMIERTQLFREKKNADDESDGGAKSKKADRQGEKLIEALSDMPPYSYLIMVATDKADKRRKLYKTVLKVGCVLEATPLRPWEAQKQIRVMAANLPKPLDRDALSYLDELVGVMQTVSLDFIAQEFEKMQLYADGDTVTKADVAATFSALPEISVFSLTDAINARDAKKALTLLHGELSGGTAVPIILAILVKHTRQLWEAKELMAKRVPVGELGAKLGINPFIGKKLGQAAVKFDVATLKNVLLALADADYKLKTGQGGNELLESAIISLCRSKNSRGRAAGW